LATILRENKVQTIVHLAALHHIPTCEREKIRAFRVNVLGTQAVLDAAECVGVKSVVLASSGAVYSWGEGMLEEDVSPTEPCDTYSICKLTNEWQLRIWANRTGCTAIIARLFNVIGHDDPNGHLIPELLNQFETGTHILRVGNTTPRRDYIYADDAAEGFCLLAQKSVAFTGTHIFNLCSGQENSVGDIINHFADLYARQVTLETDPARVRKVDRPSQLGSPMKMQTTFGWQARTPLKGALAEIYRRIRPA
jgi:nucleoside-diphosphate-sugar epimerase